MDILEIILVGVSGAVLLSAIYHTALYFFINDRIVAKYCFYLWSCTLNNLLCILFYEDNFNDYYARIGILADFVFHVSLVAYLIFIYEALSVKSQQLNNFIFYFKLGLIILIIQTFSGIYFRWNKLPLDSLLFTIPIVVSVLYILIFTAVVIIIFLKRGVTKFLHIIIWGIVVNGIFVVISIYFNFIIPKLSALSNYIIYAIGMFFDVALFSIAMGYRYKEDLDEKLQSLQLASEYQLNLMKSEIQKGEEIAKTKEAERKRISRDLHDNLANTIATSKTLIETEMFKSIDENVRTRLQKISDNLTEAYTITRGKSHDLFYHETTELIMSFFNVIENYLQSIFDRSGIKFQLYMDNDFAKKLDIKIKVELFYIIKESSLNIQKHAKATNIEISIYALDANVVLVITDNGIGFGIENGQKGIGLKSIEDRIKGLRGNFELESTPGNTSLKASIPI